jgi:hypothetical protein
MASVFSYYTASFYPSSARKNQLTPSPHADHRFPSPHHISDSRLTAKLIRLLIATIANPLIRNAPHPFMDTSANVADVSMRKPRRSL